VHACQGFGQVITNPCFECSGHGRVRTRRTMTLKAMPAGVDTGTRIQLAGEGEVGPGGGPAGDLYVEVAVNPHPVFQRRGDDLHASVEVPMTAAALGASLKMETFDGPQTSRCAAAPSPGTPSRCAASASPTCAAPVAAISSCTPMVQTPTRIDAEQEALLRQLAQLRGEERPEGKARQPR
jgi:molecular chaperone DnaJ